MKLLPLIGVALLALAAAEAAEAAAAGSPPQPEPNPLGCAYVNYPKSVHDLASSWKGKSPERSLRLERRYNVSACRRCCDEFQQLPFHYFELELERFYSCRCTASLAKKLFSSSG